MINLSKATFIIPIRIESEDRMRNVITSLLFLLENFNTNIIVKEVDEKSVFQEDVLPQIKECIGEVKNLTHIFEKSDDPVFYRMKILNEMLFMATTEVVINSDCDILLPVHSYVEAYESILSGEADVVYPYGNGDYQKQVFADDELVSEFLNEDCDFSILDSKSKIWTSDFGWIQFFNRQVYIEGGMENENFRGSSPEDKERFFRFTTLGYKVKRIDEFIYHLEHSRGRNSWPASISGNPYMNENFELWNKIQQMNKEQLSEYYSNQEYLKKYYKITLETNFSVAVDSPDHLCPVGTINDNFSSHSLISEILNYFGDYDKVSMLDLGCAGGQFVVDFINSGNIAVGLEGSSHVLNGNGSYNWETYLNKNLFLCDISKEYQLYEGNKPLKFDVIHSEEVFEHIHKNDIDILLENVRRHLKNTGICVLGISLSPDVQERDGKTYVLHQSVFPPEWWKDKLEQNGFEILNGGINVPITHRWGTIAYHYGYQFQNKVRDGSDSVYFCCKLK